MNHTTRVHAIACALAITASALMGCVEPTDSNTFDAIDEGIPSASPNPLLFETTSIGSTRTKTILVRNDGSGPLRLVSSELVETDGDDGRTFEPVGDLPNDVVLDPDAELAIPIRWAPDDAKQDSAVLRIQTNSSRERILEIPIETPTLEPDIHSPRLVQFPRVPGGSEQFVTTTVTNTGQAPLQLKRLFVSPSDSAKFVISFPRAGHESDPTMDVHTWEDVLAPGDELDVRIRFAPLSTDPASAELIIDSNDPDSPQYIVSLTGNSGIPILELGGAEPIDTPRDQATHLLEFGPCSIGRSSTRTIRLRNGGSEMLEVTDVSVTDDGGGVFELVESSLPGDFPSRKLELEPDEEALFAVSYVPDAEGVDSGRMTISSNDPLAAELVVDLSGSGSTNTCPTAIAEATILGGSSTASTQVSTIPLKTLLLDGSSSSDDGSIQRYEWTLPNTPINSNARILPGGSPSEAKLFLDIAGPYVIELQVWDDQNMPSCEPARVLVLAKPDEDIHVQLVWETPSDRDEGDLIGTDVDLHYLHPLGEWDKLPYDIFWKNREADWGIPGDSSDDPSLDIDDTNGAGPENVNHDNPESGRNYSVGVYYFADNGFGASYATVRIYIEGELAYTVRDKYLEREGAFWNVAAIVWPLKDVIALDTIRQGFPTN